MYDANSSCVTLTLRSGEVKASLIASVCVALLALRLALPIALAFAYAFLIIASLLRGIAESFLGVVNSALHRSQYGTVEDASLWPQSGQLYDSMNEPFVSVLRVIRMVCRMVVVFIGFPFKVWPVVAI